MVQTDNIAPFDYTQPRQRLIWVTFRRKGYHFYPDAPTEVSYLRDRHRHIFHFRVGIEVTHDNRDIEFHMFQNWLESLYENGTLEMDHKSCEMIANDLYKHIFAKYGSGPVCYVEVAEDGECGASMTYGGYR